MSGKTNELVDWCRDASPIHDAREYDAVVASGEQVTSGLLAIVLQGMGIQARSWQGWQIPIKTSDAHASARILDIDGTEIINRFADRKEVAVIAGFQGINPQTHQITTLGRGGSDTSAVAIAAAIHADRCDIYTDVDGVYTTDPRVVPKARRLDKIAFEDMLELASLGAKVLQVRSVELGMVHNIPRVRPFQLRQARRYRPARHTAGHADLQRGGNHGKPRRHRHRLLQGRSPDFAAPARTSPAWPPRSSGRWPRPISMST